MFGRSLNGLVIGLCRVDWIGLLIGMDRFDCIDWIRLIVWNEYNVAWCVIVIGMGRL